MFAGATASTASTASTADATGLLPAGGLLADAEQLLLSLPPLPSEWSFWATWSLLGSHDANVNTNTAAAAAAARATTAPPLAAAAADTQLMGTCRTIPEFVRELGKLPVADLPVNVTLSALQQQQQQQQRGGSSGGEVGVLSVYCPCRATADRFWQRLALAAGTGLLFPPTTATTTTTAASAGGVTVLAVSVANQPTTTLTELVVTAASPTGSLNVDALKAEIRQLAGEVGMKTFTLGFKGSSSSGGKCHSGGSGSSSPAAAAPAPAPGASHYYSFAGTGSSAATTGFTAGWPRPRVPSPVRQQLLLSLAA